MLEFTFMEGMIMREKYEKLKEFLTQDVIEYKPCWKGLLEGFLIGGGISAWTFVLMSYACGIRYQAYSIRK